MTTSPTTALDLEERVHKLVFDGDLEAATTLTIKGLTPGLRAYLLGILAEDDAQDVLSATRVDIWRGLPRFRWECPLGAWAYRIAWHAVARHARDAYRRRRRPLPPSIGSRLAAPEPSTSGLSDRQESLTKLRNQLPLEARSLLVLRVGRNLEWDEVASVLSSEGRRVSSAALRKRFERLKRKLAELARERGLLGSVGNASRVRSLG